MQEPLDTVIVPVHSARAFIGERRGRVVSQPCRNGECSCAGYGVSAMGSPAVAGASEAWSTGAE